MAIFEQLDEFCRLMFEPKAPKYGGTYADQTVKVPVPIVTHDAPGFWRRFLRGFTTQSLVSTYREVTCWQAARAKSRSGHELAILVDTFRGTAYASTRGYPDSSSVNVTILTEEYLLGRAPEDAESLLTALRARVQKARELEEIRQERKRDEKANHYHPPKKEPPASSTTS